VSSLELLFTELQESGIALELLGGIDLASAYRLGVRLRTFGKDIPKNKMVLAAGDSFEEAANQAVAKAEARRWETLDFSARPWEVRSRQASAGRFGT